MSDPDKENKVNDTADGKTVATFDKEGKRTDHVYESGFVASCDDQLTPYIA
ncbi:MAG: hypothetical protein KJ697_01840 [Nanoarchaeota archaeon]|nr:hypothetical protein [Nanoarchaeota archaeon]MBU4123846.1 hypothetical protein [Nanoarchaeota archaeon]